MLRPEFLINVTTIIVALKQNGMKLRILKSSLNQLQSILAAATQSSSKGQFRMIESSGPELREAVDVEVNDAIYNAISEHARSQLQGLCVVPKSS